MIFVSGFDDFDHSEGEEVCMKGIVGNTMLRLTFPIKSMFIFSFFAVSSKSVTATTIQRARIENGPATNAKK